MPRIVWIALIALIALAVGLNLLPQAQPRPNVLLVSIDTLRADHVGAYGYPLAKTPTLDALAKQGTLFEEALSSAPITLPSHTTILSGLLPPSHGVRDNGAYAVPDSVDMAAELLAEAGYQTQAFVSAVVLAKRYNIQQGFQLYDDALWSEEDPNLFMIRERQAPETIDRALAWFDGWKQSDPATRKPFFTWVHLFDPHEPHLAPGGIADIAATPYDAEITFADQHLGRLIDALGNAGVLDNTLIIVTADHGESLGEHGEKTHAVFVYRATTHVPLIVRLPSRFPASRRVSTPVHHIDILPTILATLGLPARDLPGRDLRAIPATGDADRPLYSESLLSEVGFGMAPLHAIRQDHFTYIEAPRPELYNLQIDPDERSNVFGVPSNALIANNLELALRDVFADAKRHAHEAGANPLSQESVEMLQSLGYLQSSAERQAVAGMDPKDGIVIYNQLDAARKAGQKGQWPEAEGLVRQILAEVPGHATARGILAFALLRQGKVDAARHEYLTLIADNPQEFRVLGALANLELRQGNMAQASNYFQSALKIAPTFVEALSGLALISMIEGNDLEAETYITQALEIDPDFPGVYRLLADRYFENGQFEAALQSYQQSLRGRPDDFRTLLQAGASARRAAQPELALSYLDKAIRLRPDAYVGHYNRACLVLQTSGLQAALPSLDAALKLEPAVAQLIGTDSDWQAVLDAPELRQRMQRDARARAPAQHAAPMHQD
ncbi:hypothetical protein C7S18_15170 [Ahniella affigens]|uniref:Sulfatase N-terminal domain-containing protein n=1 Tax=Ahniella affigens TaxID=2021234 RepID=A0A2P1PUC5_9GAMM|nr:sulfatase-like hydrolase/transferase [Ahniella affigens]AVP98445.1 hypothetical protein C7S18_15170 [Ahniella affigens]